MDAKTYLREFAKGPCNPVLNVPAMLSGRITMDMVCSQAKVNYAKTWKACGWYIPCNKKTVQIFPPSASFAASFFLSDPFNAKDNLMKCFIELFSLDVSFDKTGNPVYYQKQGITPRPQWEGAYNLGSVERKESCGFRANNKIVNGPSLIGQLQIEYLATWWDEYKHLGYRSNLTIFNYAYDWRFDAKTAAEKWGFKEMAEQLYTYTNKKIVVAGHSYGVNVGYEGLSLFPKERRQKIFKSFIAAGGPWLGSYIPLDYQMGGEFSIGGMALPKGPEGLMKVFASLGVLYTLNPKDMWLRFADTPWMKKTATMVDYYNGKVEKNPFDWMPVREILCNKSQRSIAKTETLESGTPVPGAKLWMSCDFGLRPMTDLGTVGKTNYNLSQVGEFQRKYASRPDAEKLWKHWNTYKESAFENFGLTTYFVVQNNLDTPHATTYSGVKKDGKTLIQKNKKQEMGAGDATVPFASLLGPIFKWAEEYNPKDPKTKPVKLIHYCNNLGQRSKGEYHQTGHWEKELFAKKNSYLGLPCVCGTPSFFMSMMKGGPKLGSVCNHSNAVADPNVHAFYNKIMIDRKPHNGKLNAFMEGIDGKYLGQIAGHCLAEKPWFLENWRQNLTNKVQSFLKREDANWRRTRRRLAKNVKR